MAYISTRAVGQKALGDDAGLGVENDTSLDTICLFKHTMCVKEHIYKILASRRRQLGMSQQELAARPGLRREKVNRVESKGEDLGVSELCRLLDAVGLELSVSPKGEVESSSLPSAAPRAQRKSPSSHFAVKQAPRAFQQASFIDGSKAKILNWGKVPR